MSIPSSITQRSENDQTKKYILETSHLKALDGFRGLLAMWVYLGHLANAVGFKNYVLSMHALAVDLFMILSGFLMAYTWKTAISLKHTFSFSFTNTAIPFYVKRFFRIAPLYYFLLIFCYFFLPALAEIHDSSLKIIPSPWAEGLENYNPSTVWDFSNFKWLILHITFAFGVVPGMESTTPLPDWSLSLEMQFYLIMPLLVLVFGRVHIVLLATATAVLAFYAPSLFGNYLTPGSIAHFGQPSFIAYRLNAFLAGMVVAVWLLSRRVEKPNLMYNFCTALSCFICILPLSKPVILGYLFFVILILRPTSILNQILSLKPLRFLGDISYSVYLSHLLIVIPTVYWLVNHDQFWALNDTVRFIFAVGLTTPLVILIGFILFRTIENPFTRLGQYFFKPKKKFTNTD